MDNFQYANRREPLEYSRDTNAPVLSQSLFLQQTEHREESKNSFILFLPVYSPGEVNTIDQRREKIQGWISVSFSIETLVNPSLVASNIRGKIMVFDESRTNSPLFSSVNNTV